MVCHNCQVEAKKHGKDRKGNQRFCCEFCLASGGIGPGVQFAIRH
jgi:transposase-like protein